MPTYKAKADFSQNPFTAPDPLLDSDVNGFIDNSDILKGKHGPVPIEDEVTSQSVIRVDDGDSSGKSELAFALAGTDGIYLRTDTSNNRVELVRSNGVVLMRWVYAGSPTGIVTDSGLTPQGDGSINATAIYDDGTPVTDYVYDRHYDGEVREADTHAPDDYRPPTIDEHEAYTREHRHLPALPGRDDWPDSVHLGSHLSALTQSLEEVTLHVYDLHHRLRKLESDRRRWRVIAILVALVLLASSTWAHDPNAPLQQRAPLTAHQGVYWPSGPDAVRLFPPLSLSGSVTLYLPGDSPADDECLMTTSAGVMRWAVCGSTSGGGGGHAPSNAQYLTLTSSSDLSQERVFTAGDGISCTDAGAGSTYTCDVDLTGSGASSRIAVWSDADTLTGYSTLTYNGTDELYLSRSGGAVRWTIERTDGRELSLLTGNNGSGWKYEVAPSGCAGYLSIDPQTDPSTSTTRSSNATTIDCAGRWGIRRGATGPDISYSLDVAGDARIRGDLSIDDQLDVLSEFRVTATEITATADACFGCSLGATPSAALQVSGDAHVDGELTSTVSSNGLHNQTFANTSTGTGAFAELNVCNAANRTNCLLVGVGGSGFTTQDGFEQNAAHIGPFTGVTGGLNLWASGGDVTIRTNGFSDDPVLTLSSANDSATFAGTVQFDGGFTSSGSSTIQGLITTTGTGTGDIAEIAPGNASGLTNRARLIATGQSFTASGIYPQDGAVLEAGSALSAGLHVATSAAAAIDFYTSASLTLTLPPGGGVQHVDRGTRPTCDSSTRATVWYDAGAAGVADSLAICVKNAGDSYFWHSIY